ncbi:hypothetical protein JG688_00006436 [Phytophthora aleatoria]|uniref:Uncharacterized protein n=1 Tax=Phytophthora aleatoria TaxID=2496075 RepID=A0A8J5IQQ0_9STRA|nr:hypothetical protein JG688_00006436 [Phytophthora aleatoria]
MCSKLCTCVKDCKYLNRHFMGLTLVECAVMNSTIEIMLGWDQARNAPKRGGGIFGVVRAFVASTKNLLAGDLHAHFAV